MTLMLVGPSTKEGKTGLQWFNVAQSGLPSLLPMFQVASGLMRQSVPELRGPFRVAAGATVDSFTPTQVQNAVRNLPTINVPPYADYTLLLNTVTAELHWAKKNRTNVDFAGQIDLTTIKPNDLGDEIMSACRYAITRASKMTP